jgi:CubicO group peptidase (beta-lactamase class C family)
VEVIDQSGWTVARGLEPVADLFAEQLRADPEFHAQVAVQIDGELVFEAWCGRAFGRDSLVGLFSASKGLAAIVVGTLLDEGVLELDAPVRQYWPEFAQAGKGSVTVREALSHRAGVPFVDSPDTLLDLLADADRFAALVAAQPPVARPDAGWIYHPLTVGAIVDQLCRRTAGETFAERFERLLRGPLDAEVWFGLPEPEEPRVVPVRIATPALAEPASPTLAELVALPLLRDRGLEMLANSRAGRRICAPAGSAVGSARGLTTLYSELGGPGGRAPLVSPATLACQREVHSDGLDLGSGQLGRFGILFQLPHPGRPFAGGSAMGHDGACGSFGFWDPSLRMAFGFASDLAAPPGGDRRADALAMKLAVVAAG